MIEFAGQVLLGAVILTAGFWVAGLAMGLRAMGIADDIVNLAFGLALGAIAEMEKVATDNDNRIDAVDPFARKLVGKYLDNRRDDIGKLTRAVTEADFETIRVTGHNLYGSGAAYGFDEISGIGAGIERAANSEDIPTIRRFIAELQGLLAKLGIG